ncbi:hypothetical protein [uncultured Veillonella sp.]|uniref:hypothetical protein n=1 Tax=uncultured Veillonella sp. TaxID=159268 RepID=UPI00261F939B|nr:hypothetical protein [uncultured Veillonella sp.]
MIKEKLVEMASSYFKVDQEKFMNVVNNIENLDVKSVDDIKNLDQAQLTTLVESLTSAFGDTEAGQGLVGGLTDLAGKFFK